MEKWSKGRWIGWVLLAAATVCSMIVTSKSVVHCSATLVNVPEPAGWESWKKESGQNWSGDSLFGFVFLYDEPMGAKYPGYGRTELVDPKLCPRSHISLDNWFTSGNPWWSRSPAELWMHYSAEGDVMVISGIDQSSKPIAEERFVTAFRRNQQSAWFRADRIYPIAPYWCASVLGIAGLAMGLKSGIRGYIAVIVALISVCSCWLYLILATYSLSIG